MADGATIANAYVQIMPSAEGATSAVSDAILPGMEKIGDDAGGNLGAGLLAKLKGLAAPLAAAISALGIGKMLVDIGAGFDEMRDTIIIGTGASGEALAELEGIAKDVATTVPVSFAEAGDAIQDLNTRLGLTGDDLRDVATQLGALSSMGISANVETLSGAFAAWGVEADDMASEMDYLFSVSQNTGLGFDQLTSILETSAPAMQQLGFSMEETANMAGLLDQAGMDASGMMSKMQKAFSEIAAEGGDAGEVFEQMLGEMQGYIDAGDTAAAMDIAESLFGTRGATQFLQAVESGTIDMDAFRDAALGAGDGIMATYEATASWTEKLDVLKNKAAVALEPLASFAFDALGAGIDMVTAAFEDMLPAVEPLIDAIGTVLTETVFPMAESAFETFFPIVEELGTIFLNVATVVIGAVQNILDTVKPILDTIFATISGVFNGIKTTIEGVVKFVTSLVKGDFEGMSDAIGTIFNGIKETASSVWNGISSIVGGVVENIKTVASDAWESVRSTAASIWEGVKSAIETPINSARDIVSGAIDAIKGFFSFEFHWPHIPLPHFSISGSANPLDWITGGLPQIGISWYGTGGIVDGATLIGAGERGSELIWPSYEPELSRWADALASRMDGAGTTNYYIDGSMVAADAQMAAALEVVADRARSRRRMGVAY